MATDPQRSTTTSRTDSPQQMKDDQEERSKRADAGVAPEQADRQTAPGEPDDISDHPDRVDDSGRSLDRRKRAEDPLVPGGPRKATPDSPD